MIKFLKRNIVSLFIAVLLVTTFVNTPAMASPSLDVKGESAMLIDAESGRILYQKNPDEKLHPASMSKMMTEYILLENIKKGNIKWDQNVPISDYVYKISQNTTLSNVPLRKDGQYTVRELYESMAIYSANGSTIALAELIAGTEAKFVDIMNDEAAKLGLKDYSFVNSTGLNNSDLIDMQPKGGKNDENTMSARAVATLAYRLIHDYPEVLNTCSITKKVFKEGTKMDNWNWMLPGLVFGYNGVDGLKTGSTDLGGYSFTATAKRNDLRLISVVMKTGSYEERFGETKKLLDYGFNNYSRKKLYPAGYKIASNPEIPVTNGKQKKVAVESKDALVVTVKKGEENSFEPAYELNKSVSPNGSSLTAPLEKGQTIGYLTAKYKGSDSYGYLAGSKGDKASLITSAQVKKAGWLIMLFRNIARFISNLF